MPEPLPPEPRLDIDASTAMALSRADQALGRLDGSVSVLPNADLFVFMYVRKEAVLSSQIEGTQSSLHDLLAAEADVVRGVPKDVAEVSNYVAALRLGLERLSDLPVSVRLIRTIHARLLEGVRGGALTPGELRRSQNWIGSAGATISTATFVPPPHNEIPRLLGEWESFVHSTTDIPALVKIALAHAQFETIHPFLDGNGRLGRLLITFLLVEQGILREPVLYLSHYFKQHRQEYYARLHAVRDEGAWEAWVAFFLDGVSKVADAAAVTAQRILQMREEHRAAVTDAFGRLAGLGHQVLDALYERPIMTVKDVAQLVDRRAPTAYDLVRRFEEEGILLEITGNQRNKRYRFEPYVALFSD